MNKQSQETHPGVSWLMIGLLVILGLIVLMMASPIVVRANTRADMTMATSNAKQIFYLLIEFDMDYGEFPGDATAIVHKKGEGGEEVDLRAFKGRYSNDYFGQFFGAGYVKSE